MFRPFVQTPPVAPLAQLLSVLPRTSAHLIPQAARHLVTDEASPLAENYPELIKVRGERREARVNARERERKREGGGAWRSKDYIRKGKKRVYSNIW